MKNLTKFICSMAAGAAMCAGTFHITKGKQEKAKREKAHVPYGVYEAVFKRPLDIAASGAALVLLSPAIGIITIVTTIKMNGNPFFMQQRPGKEEKIFKLIKFRSMTNERKSNGDLLPDTARMTDFGKFLRASSLDELPELINILKGDMSFVGPRPLAVQYLPFYNEEEQKRHSVLPGLTGLAQVHGRNATTWEERLDYDVQYTKHISFAEDLRILFETIKVVFKHSGIGTRGIDSPEDFDEYRKKQWAGIKDGSHEH